MNYGRPQFVRDLMAANGDAHKPIWISEMAWNAVPDEVADKRFGQVTLEQQARYTPLAYQRALEEWPWVGVINTWYFKRASDEWVQQGRPEAYFRLADPDFTLQPVYDSLKSYLTTAQPGLYPGLHEANGWGIEREGAWDVVNAPGLPYDKAWQSSQPGARLHFTFYGTGLALQTGCSTIACNGAFSVVIDGGAPVEITAGGEGAAAQPFESVVRGLADGAHTAVIEVIEAPAGIAAIRVER
jgi:hypothetical protein